MTLRLNRQTSRLQKIKSYGLLKLFKQAIKHGDFEQVLKCIERGVNVHHLDSRRRNYLMIAMKYETENQRRIIHILLDARCNVNQVDTQGWNCVHYACANGAPEILIELLDRGATVVYNALGKSLETFVIPKRKKTTSLLEHTTEEDHLENIKNCWKIFDTAIAESGYTITVPDVCQVDEPLKIHFTAPEDHHIQDHLRIIDTQSSVPITSQMKLRVNTIPVPPGPAGSITVDREMLSHASMYQVFYEQYQVPGSGETVQPLEVLDNVMNVHVVEETKENTLHALRTISSSLSSTDDDHLEDNQNRRVVEHSNDLRIRVMSTKIDVTNDKPSEPCREYSVEITHDDKIGLVLALTGKARCSSKKAKPSRLIVQNVTRESLVGEIREGDYLIRVGKTNVEFGGLNFVSHLVDETPRPLVLHFREAPLIHRKGLLGCLLIRVKSYPQRKSSSASSREVIEL